MESIILSEKIRKANKDHICNFCGCAIEKGKEYEFQSYRCEDGFYTWKCHKDCSLYSNKVSETESEGITSKEFKYQVEKDRKQYKLTGDNHSIVHQVLKIEEE